MKILERAIFLVLFCWTSAMAFVPTSARRWPSSTSLSSVFDNDDTSAVDALLRFGPAPFIIRITQPQKYWDAVDNFQEKDGCSRLIAVRNMDAYFCDPNGWVLRRDRAINLGEEVDYTRPSGVQKRPVFSFFWAAFIFWFFFNFLPTRMTELGGFHPSALSGGLCTPDVRYVDDNGDYQFECSKPGAIILPGSPFSTK